MPARQTPWEPPGRINWGMVANGPFPTQVSFLLILLPYYLRFVAHPDYFYFSYPNV